MLKFIKSLGIYFFGNILSKIIIFFMLPLYTAKISPGDYGYYDVTLTYLEIATGVIFVNLQLGILRFMYDKKTLSEKYETVYNAVPIYLMSLILFIITIFVVDIFFNVNYIFWIMLYGVFFTLEKCLGYIARGLGRNSLFAFSGILSTIVIVGVNLIGLLVLNLDYWVLYLAFVLGSLTQVIIISFNLNLFKSFSLRNLNFREGIEIIKFCAPMAVNSVVYWFLSGFNKIVIANVLGTTANGYYAIAIKFGVIVSLVGTVFGWVWQEISFEVETTKSKDEKSLFYSSILIKYLQFLILGISGTILVVKLVFPYIIHSSYHEAFSLVPLYMIASTLNTYSTFYTNIFAAIKRTKVVFYSTIIASIVNFLIMTYLVNIVGIQASNISLIISYTVDIIFKHYFLKKEMNIKSKYNKVLVLTPLLLFVLFSYFNFNELGDILSIAFIAFVTIRVFANEIKSFFSEINGIKQKKYQSP